MKTPVEILCDGDWPGRNRGRRDITIEDMEILAELAPKIREVCGTEVAV
jgi:hypothetical protein